MRHKVHVYLGSLQVVACDDNEVAQHIRDAHIAVPFMAKLDEATLSAARQLRMVIQYGVGVETTDLAAVRPVHMHVAVLYLQKPAPTCTSFM